MLIGLITGPTEVWHIQNKPSVTEMHNKCFIKWIIKLLLCIGYICERKASRGKRLLPAHYTGILSFRLGYYGGPPGCPGPHTHAGVKLHLSCTVTYQITVYFKPANACVLLYILLTSHLFSLYLHMLLVLWGLSKSVITIHYPKEDIHIVYIMYALRQPLVHYILFVLHRILRTSNVWSHVP